MRSQQRWISSCHLRRFFFIFFTFFNRFLSFLLFEHISLCPCLFLFSKCQVSAREDFVCPIFGDEMRVVDAVHPLLDQNVHRTVPTPNNIVSKIRLNWTLDDLLSILNDLVIDFIYVHVDCDSRIQFLHDYWAEYERQNGLHKDRCYTSNHGSGVLLCNCFLFFEN